MSLVEHIISEYISKFNEYEENKLDRFLHEFYRTDDGKKVKLEDRASIWLSVSEGIKNQLK